jgi:HAD superfamily hydrolase (TIGR01484 family)
MIEQQNKPEPARDLTGEAMPLFGRVHTVLTDIDDTITTNGRLPARAYGAIERLSEAGFRVIPLTGRPAGWCDMIARFWPVAGIVGENGAFAFRYDHDARRMTRYYESSEVERRERQARLQTLAPMILEQVPGSAIASDQAFRVADLAIDFCEDVAPLDAARVQKIVEIFRSHGATAKVSSIHVNAWFGTYDKLTMTKRFLAEAFGATLGEDDSAFIGDSPNDEPMFAALPLSVGVANVRAFLSAMAAKPRYITRGAGGEGFAEFADLLIDARKAAR